MATRLNHALTHSLSHGDFDTANRVFFRLYQSSNLMHKVGTRFVADFGATTQQWGLLGALARPAAKNGMSIKDLLEFLLVSRQNLTPLLDRLEGRGWIERMKDPTDGRNRLIGLTTLGQETWSAMLNVIAGFYEESLNDFTVDEQILLYRLLDRLKVSLSRLSDVDNQATSD